MCVCVCVCKTDILLIINSVSEPVLFADDTSVVISSRNFEDFCSVPNLVLSRIVKWFAANNLVLNSDETNIIKFITKNSSHSALYVGCKEKRTYEVCSNSIQIGIVLVVHWVGSVCNQS